MSASISLSIRMDVETSERDLERGSAENEKIEAKLNAALAELAQARTKAMAVIETIAADSAADIVEKLSGTRPAAAAARAAAKSVLAEA